MRRRLVVMRHAKSSWDSHAVDDHGRPLNKRGKRDAPAIAKALQHLGWTPEIVYSSDSQRTTETFERMCDQLCPTPSINYLPALYHGGIHEIRDAVIQTSDDVQTVMVLGHNPGWQHAVGWLSGKFESMTTANAALLETSSDNWRDAMQEEGGWQLIDVLRPKEIDSD